MSARYEAIARAEAAVSLAYENLAHARAAERADRVHFNGCLAEQRQIELQAALFCVSLAKDQLRAAIGQGESDDLGRAPE